MSQHCTRCNKNVGPGAHTCKPKPTAAADPRKGVPAREDASTVEELAEQLLAALVYRDVEVKDWRGNVWTTQVTKALRQARDDAYDKCERLARLHIRDEVAAAIAKVRDSQEDPGTS